MAPERKFALDFQEVGILGCGGFSTVFEVKSIKERKSYAIKKIPINIEEKDKAIKEIDFLSRLDSRFVVNYYDSWIEDNYYASDKNELKIINQNLIEQKSLLLHIQIELCSMNLDDLIKQLKYERKNTITVEQYTLVCDVFTQLLKCVNYLHNQSPQIIHRDVKPENILLIRDESLFKVKLSDFGLSTYHKHVNQSHTKYIGTKRYRAPEVETKEYGNKADVYSVGKVMEQLFNINHNSDICDCDLEISSYYHKAKQICLNCVSYIAKQRPDCQEILNDKHRWNYKNINYRVFLHLLIQVRKEPLVTIIKREHEFDSVLESASLLFPTLHYADWYFTHKETSEAISG